MCPAPVVRLLADRLLNTDTDRQRLARTTAQYGQSGLADYYFHHSAEECRPRAVFEHLRWGGQVIFTSPHARLVEQVQSEYEQTEGYRIDQPCQSVSQRWWGLPLPLLRRRQHFFVARKVLLTLPGEPTDRYSYDVRLVPSESHQEGYVVLKQVPQFDSAVRRLTQRFPEAGAATIEKSARKLVDKVFPVFLTREAAILKILQRDLPEAFKDRVPRILHLEKDDRGFVRKLYLNWLRLGGKAVSQLEFARQGAQLLHVLHEMVRIIHLDLRLDNFVVTDGKVGFVDFGSAVRMGEDFSHSTMLSALFSEMLSTSQIQRDLRQLLTSGKVTSSLFRNSYQKIDKAIDLFYLVLQMNNPWSNPDFHGLVDYRADSPEACGLVRLSQAVLQPADPAHPPYRSAKDVLDGIEQLN